MRGRFNGVAALKSGEEIVVKNGKIYGNELVVVEMLERDAGILWKAAIVPSTTRLVATEVRDKKFRISNVVVDCEENKTTFDIHDTG